jgi:hypothetical protein
VESFLQQSMEFLSKTWLNGTVQFGPHLLPHYYHPHAFIIYKNEIFAAGGYERAESVIIGKEMIMKMPIRISNKSKNKSKPLFTLIMNSIRYIIAFFTLISTSSFAQVFELPKEWPRDFKITAYYGGGDLTENKHVIFTFDSCTYIYEEGAKKVVTNYAINPDDHDEILAKMNKLNIAKIVAKTLKTPSKDKEIAKICFKMGVNKFCIENSEKSKINKADETNFATAYHYLIQFGTVLGMQH